MPRIRGITIADNVLQITKEDGITSLNPLIIPSTSIQGTEDWLNNTYLPPIANGELQIVAHVFSTSPLKVAVFTANLGVTIPNNWWIRN